MRGAGASCLPAVSPGADAAGRGFTLAACSLGRGHFRTHAQPRGCRSRVGGEDEQGAAQAAPRLPGVLRFPSHRASGVRSRPCLQTGFQRKFVVFLFLPPLPLFPQSGQRQIRQGRGPWRRRGPLSHRGWPSGLSEPVSSPVSRRKEERKTTDPFSPLRPPREGTGRACLSGENRESKRRASREEQGGTAAADYTSRCRRCPLLGSQESRAESVGFAYLLL